MTVLKRRTRIISFRLFEDEYHELESLCISQGIRSISDLARSALCRLAREGGMPADENLEDELWKLKNRMEGLDGQIKKLGEIVGIAAANPAEKRAKAVHTA
jgi:hypothetical protein